MHTILITGANRGIGLELTRHFLNLGWHVIATCRAPEQATSLQTLASSKALRILPLEVSSTASINALTDTLAMQAVDVLVNNAGVMGGEHQSLADMDYDAWLHTFAVNTLAPFHVSTALLPNLLQAELPRIITISSQMGAFGLEMGTGSYAYRSSKSAVSKVMQVMAQELHDKGVVVCPVHPGWVRTDMGGPHAEISAEQSAAGIATLITGLTLAESGRFWTWDGREHVW